MKVFISWSKPESRAIADLFRDWLPKVIQECRDPFMSTETSKGEAWFTSITGALEAAKVGVVFITGANQHEPWLNFESGALLTKLNKQKLYPVLVGLKKADYDGPLTNLQLTEFDDKEDMRRFLQDLNGQCDEPLDTHFLDEEIDLRWASLQSAAEGALKPLKAAAPQAARGNVRSTSEKIDELLELVRDTHVTSRDQMAYMRYMLESERDRSRNGAREREIHDLEAAERRARIKQFGTSGARVVSKEDVDAGAAELDAVSRYLGQFVFRDGKLLGEVTAVEGGGERLLVTTTDKGVERRRFMRPDGLTFGDVPF